MNSFAFLVLVLAVVTPSIVYSFSLSPGPIGGDLISTARIVAKMCQGVNATTAQAFWDCYNEAPVRLLLFPPNFFTILTEFCYALTLPFLGHWDFPCLPDEGQWLSPRHSRKYAEGMQIPLHFPTGTLRNWTKLIKNRCLNLDFNCVVRCLLEDSILRRRNRHGLHPRRSQCKSHFSYTAAGAMKHDEYLL